MKPVPNHFNISFRGAEAIALKGSFIDIDGP